MQIVTNVRTLKEIFASGEPRIHEYEALIAKARRHQKAKALLQIVDIYACTHRGSGRRLRRNQKVCARVALPIRGNQTGRCPECRKTVRSQPV